MKQLPTKWEIIFIIVLVTLIFVIIYTKSKVNQNEGNIIYEECYNAYMEKYNQLTEGIDETNVHEKVQLLYTDANKELIEEMGTIIDKYDDELSRYDGYYILYFRFKELYQELKNNFYKLEKWDELSYSEQIEISVYFVLDDF
jgi:broad-specificity NMP kinase